MTSNKRIRQIGVQGLLMLLMGVVSVWQVGFAVLQSYQWGEGDDSQQSVVPVSSSTSASAMYQPTPPAYDKSPPPPSSSLSFGRTNTTWNRICDENPYVGALQKMMRTYKNETALERAALEATAWLENGIHTDRRQAEQKENNKQTHRRFFPFRRFAQCKESCIGGACRDDTSKIVCGIEQLDAQQQQQQQQQQQRQTTTTTTNSRCIIYSIGGNNLWQFELDLLKTTPCEIHTFDCTGDISRFETPRHSRLHFHPVCLGTTFEPAPASPVRDEQGICLTKILNETTHAVARIQKCGETWSLLEMQQRLKHTRIDLFKLDTEGWEWPLFESWPELLFDPRRQASSSSEKMLLLPMQILVEIHYRTKFPELLALYNHTPYDREFKFASDMVELNGHLIKMGYIVVTRDDNRFCRHCTELTLLRIFCPPSEEGVSDGPAIGAHQ